MTNKILNGEIILQIPINEAILKSSYVELFSDEMNIGTIPFLEFAGKTFAYDTNIANLNKLRWDLVYKKHEETINKKIKELLNEDNLLITIGTFRRLYVKKSSGELKCSVTCSYVDKQWHIHKEIV
jgi:hypothetical protein